MEPESSEAAQALFTVDQVAARLQLHPKTVRQHIREGRLAATRIGKSYRIAARDLAALAGAGAATPPPSPLRTRRVEVSSIVDIAALDPDAAGRIANGLVAAAHGRERDGEPLRVDTIYYPEQGRLKVVLTGSLSPVAALMQLIALYADPLP